MAYKIYQKLQSGMAGQGLIDAKDVDVEINGVVKPLSEVLDEIDNGGGGSVKTVNGTDPDASGDIKLDIVSKADCTMDSEKIIVGLLNKDDDTLFNLDIGAVSTTGAGVMTPAMLAKLNSIPKTIAVPISSFDESRLESDLKDYDDVYVTED